MKIVLLVGEAGSGKDTVAQGISCRYVTRVIAFADPMKKFLREVLDFSVAQLWGPSALRNAPDSRYPRYDSNGDITGYLTPRYALQTLGTEWGRSAYPDIWVDATLRHIKEISAPLPQLVVITDGRFVNEVRRIRAAGGYVVAVQRETDRAAVEQAGIVGHASEVEQRSLAVQEYVTHTVSNSGSLDELAQRSWAVVEEILGA